MYLLLWNTHRVIIRSITSDAQSKHHSIRNKQSNMAQQPENFKLYNYLSTFLTISNSWNHTIINHFHYKHIAFIIIYTHFSYFNFILFNSEASISLTGTSFLLFTLCLLSIYFAKLIVFNWTNFSVNNYIVCKSQILKTLISEASR